MATDRSVSLTVKGLREVQAALRQIGGGMERALSEELMPIAQRVVAVAQSKVPGSGRARGSIKPRVGTRGASIAFGGSAAPHFPWLDFGGSTGRGHRPGRAWSGAIKRDWRGNPVGMGRYVYPAISEQREETAEAVDSAVERLAKRAGFETKGGI